LNSFTSSIKNIFFSTVYVGINIEQTQCKINVDIKRGDKLKQNIKKIFYINDGKVSDELNNFIYGILNKYNFTFIMALNNSTKQGAMTQCGKEGYRRFNIDPSQVTSLCIDQTWQSYIYTSELHQFQDRFEGFELDYITSPFIMQSFILDKEDRSGVKLVLLNQKDTISVGIFRDGTIIFSTIETLYTPIAQETRVGIVDEDIEDIVEDKIDDEFSEFEDDIDEDMIDTGDDIEIDEDLNSDLESLDGGTNADISIDDMGDDQDSQYKRDQQRALEQDTQNSIKILGIIKSSIDDFYKSDLYESDFIEKIIIATDEKLSKHTKEFIEDEILLDIDLINIDVSEVLSKLAYEESVHEV
jgi:hypothetical protein